MAQNKRVIDAARLPVLRVVLRRIVHMGREAIVRDGRRGWFRKPSNVQWIRTLVEMHSRVKGLGRLREYEKEALFSDAMMYLERPVKKKVAASERASGVSGRKLSREDVKRIWAEWKAERAGLPPESERPVLHRADGILIVETPKWVMRRVYYGFGVYIRPWFEPVSA